MPSTKTVSILGCGWYGFSLATKFVSKGIAVRGSTTSTNKLQQLGEALIEPYLVNFSADNETYDPSFFKCDVLFVCIPPKIRAGNAEDYLNKIKRIIKAIKTNKVKQVVFISSTGVYGDLNTEVNELTAPIPDTESGRAMLKAEELLKHETDFTTTIIRFAGLIGPGRDPGRFFAGKTGVPNGKAPINLIHLTDCVGISCAIIDKEAFGFTFNACSPCHPQKADFYTKAAISSGLVKPEFLNELNNWKMVSGDNVNSILNYHYRVADLMKWLG
jgi:nucleoside-diphosphate-sugar epimerase